MIDSVYMLPILGLFLGAKQSVVTSSRRLNEPPVVTVATVQPKQVTDFTAASFPALSVVSVPPVPDMAIRSRTKSNHTKVSMPARRACPLDVKGLIWVADRPQESIAIVKVGTESTLLHIGDEIRLDVALYRVVDIEDQALLLELGKRRIRCHFVR